MILVDLLKAGGDCGLPISSYRYVGMGANRFYDFLLIHRYLGIKNMISLEHDCSMFKRAVFNVPYRFIQVQQKSAEEFIATDTSASPTIGWLDYDGGIGGHIVRDILSFATKMKIGDFCFVTVFGGPPNAIDGVNDEQRFIWLQDNLGDVAGEVDREDAEKANFPRAVHKILISAFRNAFAPRRDGVFLPILEVMYSDTKPMVTVGGAFFTEGQAHGYKSRMRACLPFLGEAEELYEIRSLHLTERERALFDRAVTARDNRCRERRELKKLGFRDSEITAYRDLVRYLPRYVETIV
jgi:hypothetical protein